MNTPANLRYAKSDEWFDPETGAIGISDYAQSQLSDIVFVEILVDEGDYCRSRQAYCLCGIGQSLRRDLTRLRAERSAQ